MASKRIQIIIDEELLKMTDDFASKAYLSRSATISAALAVLMTLPNGITTIPEKAAVIKWLKNYTSKKEEEYNESDRV